MIKKLTIVLIIIFLLTPLAKTDTNTDIIGLVILKKSFKLYIDKGRADGVTVGNRLEVLYDGRTFGSGLISWVGNDISYARLDSSVFYRFYYVQPLEARIYLESSTKFTGGAIHVPFFNDLNLKPSQITIPDEFTVGYLIYDNLVRVDSDGKIVPGLAHSWERHGNTYTFYLNSNARFHSGKYLDALDVAYSLVQLAKAPSLTPASSFVTQIEGYEEVHKGRKNEFQGVFVTNKNTIGITTKSEFVPFLKYLAGPGGFIIPAVDRTPVPIGTGPFKVVSRRDNRVMLAANAEHFENSPSLDSIIFTRYSDYKEAALDFELGRLDLIGFDTHNAEELLAGGDYQARKYYTGSLVMLGFNCQHEYQDDFDLSHALSSQFDRESIVRVLLANSARASSSLISHTFNIESSFEDNFLYSPHEAQAELMSISDLPRELNLVYDGFDPALGPIADYIAGQIRHAGVKINTQKLKSRYLEKSTKLSTMDLYLLRYDIPILDPDALFYPLFSSSLNGVRNYFNYDNNQLERFISGARRIEDTYAREDIYKETEELLMENPPVIVLYNPFLTVAHRRDLAGFKADRRAFINLRDTYYQAAK